MKNNYSFSIHHYYYLFSPFIITDYCYSLLFIIINVYSFLLLMGHYYYIFSFSIIVCV